MDLGLGPRASPLGTPGGPSCAHNELQQHPVRRGGAALLALRGTLLFRGRGDMGANGRCEIGAGCNARSELRDGN